MSVLDAMQRQVDELSEEDRQSLLTYLIRQLASDESGPDDAEVAIREAEMDSGEVPLLGHEEFVLLARPRR